MIKDALPSMHEQLDIIRFVHIIKKYRKSITIIVIVCVIASLLLAFKLQTNDYQGSASIVIGSAKDNLFDKPQELIDSLNTKTNIEATQGQPTNIIIIKTTGQNAKQAEETIHQAVDPILEKHAKLYDDQIKDLEQQVTNTKNEMQENQLYINRLASIISKSSLTDFYQVTALLNYTTLRSRNDDLQQKIARLQSQQTAALKTTLQKPITVEKKLQLISIPVSVVLGLCLGLIIGIMIAVIKEWWNRYKLLLDNN